MGVFRKISMMLGLAGGAAGIAVHAYLLAGLMAQADAPSEDVKRLAVGITLGVAGLAAGVAVRASRPASAAFLLSLGLLGFFPNPATWAPAGALLVSAGSLVLWELRRGAAVPAAKSVGASAVRPTTGSDGAPLHWSLAPHYPGGGELVADAAIPDAAEANERAAWNPRSRLLVTATVVAIAALVMPLSLRTQEPVAAATKSPTKAAVNVAVAHEAEPVAASGGASTTTSTTVATALTRIGPVDPNDPDGFVFYSDVRFGLTVSVPGDWAEVPASRLADYRVQAYHVAAFAEIKGPTLRATYLNGLTIEVLAGSQSEDPPQELVQQSMQAFVDNGPGAYDYFKVLEPIHETNVGNVPALVTTVRITWNKRVMVKSVYAFIANHCLYRVDLQTDDVDWNDHEELFEQVLDSFASGAGSKAQ